MLVVYYPKCSCGWKGEAWSDNKPQSWLSFVRFFQILRPGTIDNFHGVHLTPTVKEHLELLYKEHRGPDHNVQFVANIVGLTDGEIAMLHRGSEGHGRGF